MLVEANLQYKGIVGLDTIQQYIIFINFNTINIVSICFDNQTKQINWSNPTYEDKLECLGHIIGIEVNEIMTES